MPAYRTFIYGVFARHTASFVIAIALGQLAAGFAILAKPRFHRFGYMGGIFFLLAITPLGIGSAAPSTLIFAIAIAVLLRLDRKRSTATAGKQLEA